MGKATVQHPNASLTPRGRARMVRAGEGSKMRAARTLSTSNRRPNGGQTASTILPHEGLPRIADAFHTRLNRAGPRPPSTPPPEPKEGFIRG